MHRPFDGFSCEFTSITKCLNLQFIVGIRKNADSSLFYAVKLQIQRTARRTRVRRRARSCAMRKPHKTSFHLFCTIFKPPLESWTDFLNSTFFCNPFSVFGWRNATEVFKKSAEGKNRVKAKHFCNLFNLIRLAEQLAGFFKTDGVIIMH